LINVKEVSLHLQVLVTGNAGGLYLLSWLLFEQSTGTAHDAIDWCSLQVIGHLGIES